MTALNEWAAHQMFMSKLGYWFIGIVLVTMLLRSVFDSRRFGK